MPVTILGKRMAVHVLGRNLSLHQESEALKAKLRAAGRSETQQHSVPELHVAYAGRLSRIGSGDRDLVDIKGFGVSQLSLASQKRADGKQSNQTARVPVHRMQASVNAFKRAHGCLVTGCALTRQRLGVIAG